jgi:transcriptional regulator with XRE-family HTH domain
MNNLSNENNLYKQNKLFRQKSSESSQEASIGDILYNLMQERHVTTKRLSLKSGVSVSMINSLIRGERPNPGILTMDKLANVLDVPVSHFLNQSCINIEDYEFISKYQSLTNHGKCLVDMVLNTEYSLLKKSGRHTREIPCFQSVISAGDGFKFDSANIYYIKIENIDFHRNIDFGITITDDTLSPVYFKGDILGIDKRFPYPGEVAIFLYKDIELVRKYVPEAGQIRLASVTTASDDIVRDKLDDTLCLGTVLGIIRNYK